MDCGHDAKAIDISAIPSIVSDANTSLNCTASSSSGCHRPAVVAKLRDIVGLYVDPPAYAIVLAVDEKSLIQALDRSQPGLPMKSGRA